MVLLLFCTANFSDLAHAAANVCCLCTCDGKSQPDYLEPAPDIGGGGNKPRMVYESCDVTCKRNCGQRTFTVSPINSACMPPGKSEPKKDLGKLDKDVQWAIGHAGCPGWHGYPVAEFRKCYDNVQKEHDPKLQIQASSDEEVQASMNKAVAALTPELHKNLHWVCEHERKGEFRSFASGNRTSDIRNTYHELEASNVDVSGLTGVVNDAELKQLVQNDAVCPNVNEPQPVQTTPDQYLDSNRPRPR